MKENHSESITKLDDGNISMGDTPVCQKKRSEGQSEKSCLRGECSTET